MHVSPWTNRGRTKGLGFALAAGLAARMDPDDLVLLTGRHARRVADAAAAVSTRAGTRSRRAPAGGPRIVMASSLGTLGHLDPRLHPLFDGATLEEVEAAVESCGTALHDGTAEGQGWPRWINVPSKVAQVAAVRAVAAQRRAADLVEGTLLAAVCPGMVDTRASRPWFDDYTHAQSPEQAARAVLEFILALRPTRRPTANSSDSARSCPGTAEHRPTARTRCSAGRTGPSAPLALVGELPAFLRSTNAAAAAAGGGEADGAEKEPTR